MKNGLKFSSFSIIMVFTCLAIIGVSLIPFLSMRLTPAPSNTSINVGVSWPEASAKVIEQEVTSRLEGIFNGMKGVRRISSSSNKGHGSIDILFKEDMNMDAVRFEMANLIRQAYPSLPEGVGYPYLSMRISSEDNSPILAYSIRANQSPYRIKQYIDDHLVPKLAVLDGVSRVRVYGATPYEWVITYDTTKLFQLGIGVNEVAGAINTYLREKELGTVKLKGDKDQYAGQISVSLSYGSTREINWEGIPIAKIKGRLIHLEDIASVRFKESSVKAYYRINGLNTINMALYPEIGVNTIKLAEDLKYDVQELTNDLPAGYHVKLTRDTTTDLVKELQKIKNRSLFSLIILLVLTILIYRNVKYLAILFISITINLLIAVILYFFFKVDLQLYSFAGITISFGIMIDNTIIMMDHLRNKGNKKAFLALLAATLTTMGAVSVIFLLKESQKANLWDFALVIAINLGVSLLVAFYLVPALLDKFYLKHQKKQVFWKRKRRVVKWSGFYYRVLIICKKPWLKYSLIGIMILGFGLPLHFAPREIKKDGFWPKAYNKTLGNEWFNETIRTDLEKILGGSLRLFTENVIEDSYYSEPQRTSLTVRGRMPEGNTIEQLNTAVEKMEHYIASFEEVELFETNISSYRNSNITIYFKEAYEQGAFPYTLKSLLESRAVSLGGLDWSVTGVGRGFSNALNLAYKSEKIVLRGYNYNDLYGYASLLQDQVLEESGGRVKEVAITSGGWNSTAIYEYYLDFDKESMAQIGVGRSQFYAALKNQLHSGSLGHIVNENTLQDIKLVADRYKTMNAWDLKNAPLTIGERQYKLAQLASITKKKTGNSIKKENQQYRLTVAYDFIGPRPLVIQFRKDRIAAIEKVLPMGYAVNKSRGGGWNRKDTEQYYYLFVVIGGIFFICAVLLESLLQPLAIISMIPISFIGVFLTFYFFEFNFDQGGYAAFILLSGLSVNAALYIVNDYNNLKKRGRQKSLVYYIKAYNHKIIPICITIITTIVGLIPFVWGGQKEVFWFAFAVGSIGGLVFSLVALLVYLPLFMTGKR